MKHGIRLGLLRFLIQVTAVGFTIAGLNSLVDIDAIPFFVFAATVVLSGVFFCGWLCPFGAVQEWLRYAGSRVTGVDMNAPNPLNRYLSLSRYILWIALLFVAWDANMSPVNSRGAFAAVFSGLKLGDAFIFVMGAVLVLSIFMDRPYCRYVCQRGAGCGLASIFRIFTIKRDHEKCVSCGRCDKSCQMGIEISTVTNMRSASCINCFKCVERCPLRGALKVGAALPRLRDFKDTIDRYFRLRGRIGCRPGRR
ncbi:MAG: 4Fe-4S binding protein [Synergistaceae bacterium]|nr:4Fe-4S binding protein [Synergistaceae bacterium]